MSRLFIHAGSWYNIPKRTWVSLGTYYLRTFRRVFSSSNHAGLHLSDVDFMIKYCVMSLDNHLRKLRISYFRRFLLYAPLALKVAISHEWSLPHSARCSWLAHVIDDLVWLNNGAKLALPHPSCDGRPWHDFLLGSKFRMNQAIEMASHCSAQQMVKDVVVDPSIQPPSSHQCDECGALFATFAGMCSHQFIKHHRTNMLRRFTFCTHCVVCLKEFHTRPRLIHHIKSRSPKCSAILVANYVPLSVDVVEALDQEDNVERKRLRALGLNLRHACVPAFRLQGPLPYELA